MNESTHLLPHLPSYVCQSLLSIEALSLQPAVAQHLDDLRVFLSVLTEHQLTLVVLVLVLPSSAIFSSLWDGNAEK